MPLDLIDYFYQILEKIGYTHPAHPAMALTPSLVVAGLVLGIVARLFRRPILAKSARHCMILAYISIFPAALLGYMDWEHYYAGAWLFPIKIKIILTAILLVILSIWVIFYRKTEAGSKFDLTIYTLSFLMVVGLGYYGGHLVLAGTCPIAPKELRAGRKIFEVNCSACHPNGGNVITPNLPLVSAPQLANFDTFLAFNRDPKRPDNTQGIMPPFPPAKISDQQMRELYEYITYVMPSKPPGPQPPRQ